MKHIYYFLLLTMITSGLSAQNIYVDSAAAAGSCLGTLADPYINLQDALTTASSGDIIFVATGTYYPDERNCGMSDTDNRDTSFYIPDSVVVMGGYHSGFAMRDIHGTPFILSGDIDGDGMQNGNSYHVVRTTNVDSTTVVNGFTISGGNADGSSFPDYLGGGWYNDGSGSGNVSNPKIRYCVFSGNSADNGGRCIMMVF